MFVWERWWRNAKFVKISSTLIEHLKKKNFYACWFCSSESFLPFVPSSYYVPWKTIRFIIIEICFFPIIDLLHNWPTTQAIDICKTRAGVHTYTPCLPRPTLVQTFMYNPFWPRIRLSCTQIFACCFLHPYLLASCIVSSVCGSPTMLFTDRGTHTKFTCTSIQMPLASPSFYFNPYRLFTLRSARTMCSCIHTHFVAQETSPLCHPSPYMIVYPGMSLPPAYCVVIHSNRTLVDTVRWCFCIRLIQPINKDKGNRNHTDWTGSTMSKMQSSSVARHLVDCDKLINPGHATCYGSQKQVPFTVISLICVTIWNF